MEIQEKEPDLVVKTFGPEDTESLGKILGGLLAPGDVVGLVGDLGMGKTCFTRGIAAGVGIDPRIRVVSPTFTILNEYGRDPVLQHFDFYRLERLSEQMDLEWREYFYGKGIVVIEWAEKVAGMLPEERLTVHLALVDDDEREIRISGTGERYRQIVHACDEMVRHET